MTALLKLNFRYPANEIVQSVQDAMLISSFGLWAAVLGLSPVLAYHLLVAA